MPAKRPPPRLALVNEQNMSEGQHALLASLRAGPRGASITPREPCAAWMHAPERGELAQNLGAYCRYGTALPPRLSEFAILCTARLWRAQYEWFAHAPMAAKRGLKPPTIVAMRRGRVPRSMPKDERAIYDFIQELYKTKRVGGRTYKRVQSLLGGTATTRPFGVCG